MLFLRQFVMLLAITSAVRITFRTAAPNNLEEYRITDPVGFLKFLKQWIKMEEERCHRVRWNPLF